MRWRVCPRWTLPCALAMLTGAVLAQDPATSRMWYRAPARNWNEALPVGNGRLGAMVFGGIRNERLQLNEDTCGPVRRGSGTTPRPEAFGSMVRRIDALAVAAG